MDWVDEYSHNSFDLQCLLNSFPGDLEFKQIFSDIDEQIEQNATRQLQSVLREAGFADTDHRILH